MPEPTTTTYQALNQAYAFFNARLFNNALPTCLITLQRKNRSNGFFCKSRFVSSTDTTTCDEIALNPSRFRERGTKLVLSTLVHEMVHLWQHHYGRPGRRGYHNRQWADKMLALGLIPRTTDGSGGRQTGQRMTHAIASGDAFERACDDLLRDGFELPYVENGGEAMVPRRQAQSKARFSCVGCGQNAWAKPSSVLMCGACEQPMSATDR